MVTVKFIKELVEKKTGVFELEQKQKTNEYSHTRWVCFWLARKYTRFTLLKIGSEFNKDHASVLHGLKHFEIDKQQQYLMPYYELYTSCCKDIEKILDFYGEEKFIMSVQEVKLHYKLKHINLVEKSNEVIGSLTKKLHNFRHRPIFEEIALLSDEDLADFEVRANAFLQMKRINNKN
jgi:hypothetical protein